jgi:hypothetical protein
MNLFPLTAAHAAIQLQRGKLAICALASPAPTAALHCIAWAKAPSPSSSQGAGYLSSFDPPHAFDKDGLCGFNSGHAPLVAGTAKASTAKTLQIKGLCHTHPRNGRRRRHEGPLRPSNSNPDSSVRKNLNFDHAQTFRGWKIEPNFGPLPLRPA